MVFLLIIGVASISWAEMPGPYNAITDVPGIEVGHYTGTEYSSTNGAATGTTVILARQGAVAGVSQRGGSPGTRETDLLDPVNRVEKANAVVLSGGSAYGLATADGVMQCLEDQGIGFPVGEGRVVPIVPAAILYDPGRCGLPFNYRPDASFGLQACQAVSSGRVEQGNVGAGAGARSGGIKGGIGTASVVLDNGVIVGAIVAVNSVGRTFDDNGNFYAGFLEMDNEFHGPLLPAAAENETLEEGNLLQNTTIAVVATNASLTKAEATKIAQMADDGFARAIKTSHTTGDGDTIFALATGQFTGNPGSLNRIGGAAADALSRAVIHAILAAETIPGCFESYCDAFPGKCESNP
jgi:L-aminopeptidase/D-esterase-like protein